MKNDWILVLDESGSFSAENKYFVLAGFIYNKKNQIQVEEYINSTVNNILKITDLEELHSKEMNGRAKNFARDILFYNIGKSDIVKSVSYVIDLNKTYLLNSYDKLSFKYNKCIEWLYRDLIRYNIISDDDSIYICFDKVTFSEEESKNIARWLPERITKVKAVNMWDSKDSKLIQAADIIANSFSKNGKFSLNSFQQKALKSFIEVFPRKNKDEYFNK